MDELKMYGPRMDTALYDEVCFIEFNEPLEVPVSERETQTEAA